jgi:hypothetical protein
MVGAVDRRRGYWRSGSICLTQLGSKLFNDGVQPGLCFVFTLEGVPQAVLLGGELTDHAAEFVQPLQSGAFGFHPLRSPSVRQRPGLQFPCDDDPVLLEFADLFGKRLRLGFGAVEFGFRRFEVGDGDGVCASRYTGAGGEGRETEHHGCCGVDVHTSPRCVVLHASAQRAASSPSSRCGFRISSSSVEITKLARIAQRGAGSSGWFGLFGLWDRGREERDERETRDGVSWSGLSC